MWELLRNEPGDFVLAEREGLDPVAILSLSFNDGASELGHSKIGGCHGGYLVVWLNEF